MVNFFNITTGKLIQHQVVKKFIDIHKSTEKTLLKMINLFYTTH